MNKGITKGRKRSRVQPMDKKHKRKSHTKFEYERNNHTYEVAHIRHKARHESKRQEQEEHVTAQTVKKNGQREPTEDSDDDNSPSLDLAFSYLEKVKERFEDEEEVYITFVEILQELAPTVGEDAGALGRDTWKCTMEKVLQLLEGETDLICYFLEFLPSHFRSSILLDLSGKILNRAERILGTKKQRKANKAAEHLNGSQREMSDLARALRQQNADIPPALCEKPKDKLNPLKCQCKGSCQCGLGDSHEVNRAPASQTMREYDNGWYGYESDRTTAQQLYQTWGPPRLQQMGYGPTSPHMLPPLHYEDQNQMQQGWYPQRDFEMHPGMQQQMHPGIHDLGQSGMQYTPTYPCNPSAMNAYPGGCEVYPRGFAPVQTWGMQAPLPTTPFDSKNFVNVDPNAFHQSPMPVQPTQRPAQQGAGIPSVYFA